MSRRGGGGLRGGFAGLGGGGMVERIVLGGCGFVVVGDGDRGLADLRGG